MLRLWKIPEVTCWSFLEERQLSDKGFLYISDPAKLKAAYVKMVKTCGQMSEARDDLYVLMDQELERLVRK